MSEFTALWCDSKVLSEKQQERLERIMTQQCLEYVFKVALFHEMILMHEMNVQVNFEKWSY